MRRQVKNLAANLDEFPLVQACSLNLNILVQSRTIDNHIEGTSESALHGTM